MRVASAQFLVALATSESQFRALVKRDTRCADYMLTGQEVSDTKLHCFVFLKIP